MTRRDLAELRESVTLAIGLSPPTTAGEVAAVINVIAAVSGYMQERLTLGVVIDLFIKPVTDTLMDAAKANGITEPQIAGAFGSLERGVRAYFEHEPS